MLYDTAGGAELHKNISRNPKIQETFLFMSHFIPLCTPAANVRQTLNYLRAVGWWCRQAAVSQGALAARVAFEALGDVQLCCCAGAVCDRQLLGGAAREQIHVSHVGGGSSD